MIVFDTTVLLPLIDKKAKVPKVKGSNEQVEFVHERLEEFIRSLDKTREDLLIPSPVLAEILVFAQDAQAKYLEIIELSNRIKIAPFGIKAAIECSILFSASYLDRKTKATLKETRARTNFDNQILSIVKAEGAEVIFTADEKLEAKAIKLGIRVQRLEDLPVPDNSKQMGFELEKDDSE